jgi:hypothetical protein
MPGFNDLELQDLDVSILFFNFFNFMYALMFI